MKKWVTIILVVVAALAISSGYDFWRGFHEEHSVTTGFAYAVLSWIVYGVPVFFISWLLSRKNK